jgi:hypothetical protein
MVGVVGVAVAVCAWTDVAKVRAAAPTSVTFNAEVIVTRRLSQKVANLFYCQRKNPYF